MELDPTDPEDALYRALLYVRQEPPYPLETIEIIRALQKDGYDIVKTERPSEWHEKYGKLPFETSVKRFADRFSGKYYDRMSDFAKKEWLAELKDILAIEWCDTHNRDWYICDIEDVTCSIRIIEAFE